jgi:hypothetical protein
VFQFSCTLSNRPRGAIDVPVRLCEIAVNLRS